MGLSAILFACRSPKELLAGVRICLREGCGVKEALSISVRSILGGSGIEGINDELAGRLERSMWIAEHPGCTAADIDAWEYEQLEEAIADFRLMLFGETPS